MCYGKAALRSCPDWQVVTETLTRRDEEMKVLQQHLKQKEQEHFVMSQRVEEKIDFLNDPKKMNDLSPVPPPAPRPVSRRQPQAGAAVPNPLNQSEPQSVRVVKPNRIGAHSQINYN